MSVQTIYSVGVRLGRGAVGLIALKAVTALARGDYLSQLIVNAYEQAPLPHSAIRSLGYIGRALKKLAHYEPSGQATDWTDAIFDRWAVRHVSRCDIFEGWGNMCLRQLRRAHAYGALTIVNRASAHTLTQARLLREEATRWGLKQPLTVQSAVRRALAENVETDFVGVPSEFAYQSFIENGMQPHCIILNPFGVDTQRFTPPPARDSQTFRALFVGLVSAQKGVPDLLEAWRQAAIPNAELWIAGLIGAEMPPILARYCDAPNVRWLGHIDPLAAYQQADVFIFPSIQEGSALVTFEAMACGLPVIVTPNCGSLAHDGEHGFVVPIRRPDLLADRLAALARDPRLRQQMGNAARQHILQFTWERYGERLTEAYRRIKRGEKPDGPGWLIEGDKSVTSGR